MNWRIGTSGWQYKQWRGDFYPEGLRSADWFEHYAQTFDTVEINNTFYRLPEDDVFTHWAAVAPAGFCYAVKASRYLSHIKRLNEADEPVERLVTRARHLGEFLGPVLLQLPPDMEPHAVRLNATLRAFARRGVKNVALELRNPAWFTDEIRDILRKHGTALVLTDRNGESPEPTWQTAPWTYVRFHGDAHYGGRYDDAVLERWVERIRNLDTQTAYVYFNNDIGGHAPRDAVRFREAAARI